MTTPRPPRNGLGATTFVIVVLGALLAVIPATAPAGFLLLLLALVPAVVGYVLTRTGRATHRRRSIASLVLAPVFLVVAVVVTGVTAPAPPVTAAGSPASVGAASTLVGSTPPAGGPLLAPAAAAAPVGDAPAAAAGSTPDTPRALAAVPAAPTKAAPAKAVPAAASPAKTAPTKAAVPRSPAPVKASAPVTSSSAKKSASCDSATHYVNDSGNCVLRPVAASKAPAGASAKCKDGTFSSSQHRSGTCSRHGGVAQWLPGAPSS